MLAENNIEGVIHLNAIEAHHLTKNYQVYLRPFDRLKEALLRKPCHDLVEALSDVSFEVPEGGTLGIIGENGAGKSTLLKILAGTARQTFGKWSSGAGWRRFWSWGRGSTRSSAVGRTSI